MSKIIPGDQSNHYQSWATPEVDGISAQTPAKDGNQVGLPTAEQLEQIQQQAYEEAHKQGFEAGLKKGQQEILGRVQLLNRLMDKLAKPFEQLDEQVEQELVSLSIAIIKQMVRRELKSDPGQIVAVVREAMTSLPVSSRNVQLFLNPDDAKLIREALSLGSDEKKWEIVEDPLLSRGGCKVLSQQSQIDASVEKRVAQIVTSVFGGERGTDG